MTRASSQNLPTLPLLAPVGLAMIGSDDRHIGHFATPEEAARAYDAEAIKRYGEFAYLNFPASESEAA